MSRLKKLTSLGVEEDDIRLGDQVEMNILRGAVKLMVVGVGTVLFHEQIGGPLICRGPSMEPLIYTGDVLLVESISTRMGSIKSGDVVISLSPPPSILGKSSTWANNNGYPIVEEMSTEREFLCKRVCGVGGDTVMGHNGDMFVVPEGYVWLEGDNKKDSWDSRDFGPLPLGHLRRKCFLKVWPTVDAQLLNDTYKLPFPKKLKESDQDW